MMKYNERELAIIKIKKSKGKNREKKRITNISEHINLA